MNSILNIIICYKNKEEVIRYVKNVKELKSSSSIDICIVINDDTECAFFYENLGRNGIYVYKCGSNRGYLNGALCGYENIRNSRTKWDWIAISNTDIEYENKNFIQELQMFKYDDDIWAIGPDIFCPYTREHQNPRYTQRISKKKMEMYIIIYTNIVSAYLYNTMSQLKKKMKKRKNGDIKSSLQKVYEIHGAYMILSNDLVDLLVENPYKGFLYHEEHHIAEIIRINSKIAIYDPRLKVIHYEHSSTGKDSFIKKYLQMKRSYLENYKAYYLGKKV